MEICMHSSNRALENRTRRGGGSHEKVSGKLFLMFFLALLSQMIYPNAQLPIWCVLKIIQKCQMQLGLLFEQSIIFMSCAYFCRAKTSYNFGHIWGGCYPYKMPLLLWAFISSEGGSSLPSLVWCGCYPYIYCLRYMKYHPVCLLRPANSLVNNTIIVGFSAKRNNEKKATPRDP